METEICAPNLINLQDMTIMILSHLIVRTVLTLAVCTDCSRRGHIAHQPQDWRPNTEGTGALLVWLYTEGTSVVV